MPEDLPQGVLGRIDLEDRSFLEDPQIDPGNGGGHGHAGAQIVQPHLPLLVPVAIDKQVSVRPSQHGDHLAAGASPSGEEASSQHRIARTGFSDMFLGDEQIALGSGLGFDVPLTVPPDMDPPDAVERMEPPESFLFGHGPQLLQLFERRTVFRRDVLRKHPDKELFGDHRVPPVGVNEE